jgi:hypothetical protein
MLSILESLFPVKFDSSANVEAKREGMIIAKPLDAGADDNDVTVTSLTVPWDEMPCGLESARKIKVAFSSDRDVPFPFRGVSLDLHVAVPPAILVPRPGEKILAICDSAPVWVLAIKEGIRHYRSGFALPEIPQNGNLVDVLGGDRFIEMLILLQWLRESFSDVCYQGPPLRACFMFDDPNLHWPRYGCVDYSQIAQHALRGNYHVSFATIPLDTWFTHKKTADIFRRNPNHLSLLVHGNNHTWLELARRRSEASRLGLLSQALTRVEHLERTTGIPVSRVMVPPGGACVEETLGDLPKCGFEAACISHGSLRLFNQDRIWTRTLGYRPAELIQGCPVLPRWALSRAPSAVNTVLLAAYLNQPIILRGHHNDLKDGIELLDEMGKLINGLGSVLWSDLTDVSRRNYCWRMNGHVFRVKPMGRRLTVHRPAGATEMMIESNGFDDWSEWQTAGIESAPLDVTAGECVSLSDTAVDSISLKVLTEEQLPRRISEPRFAPLPILRRVLTEGRDRWLS